MCHSVKNCRRLTSELYIVYIVALLLQIKDFKFGVFFIHTHTQIHYFKKCNKKVIEKAASILIFIRF